MKQTVMIKGNRMGLTLWLDPDTEFPVILKKLEEKFEASAGFFRFSKPIALAFTGREISHEETETVIDLITEITGLKISYLIMEDTAEETRFQKLIEEKEKEAEERRLEAVRKEAAAQIVTEIEMQKNGDGLFYKGTLRSGQSVSSDSSIVVLGDVNPGATVSAAGSVVVLGALKGYAYAGTDGDEQALIVALEMKPMQIRIGKHIARNEDEEEKKRFRPKRKKKEEVHVEPQMAFVEDGNIYIEPVSKNLIQELTIS